MRRVHVIVSGSVQGVGYRYTARMIADEVGVTGWVRNRRDGTVEAEVEGTPDQVDEMLAWMAEGPPGSRVEAATVTDAAPAGGHGFEVRSTSS
jgi:acylphosphatase